MHQGPCECAARRFQGPIRDGWWALALVAAGAVVRAQSTPARTGGTCQGYRDLVPLEAGAYGVEDGTPPKWRTSMKTMKGALGRIVSDLDLGNMVSGAGA